MRDIAENLDPGEGLQGHSDISARNMLRWIVAFV
jgi:hypothetical protein